MCISGWTKAAHIQDKNTIQGEIASGVCFYFIFPLISITTVLLIYIFVAQKYSTMLSTVIKLVFSRCTSGIGMSDSS